MDFSSISRTVLASLACALVCLACTNREERLLAVDAGKGMNVLLVTVDTLRADRLGCYGHATAATPTIDALAATGLLFEQATSGSPITLPSHATILTGLDNPNHGVRHNGTFKLGLEPRTLAERYAGIGYDTAAFVSAFVLERRFGLSQGFADYDDRFETSGTSESSSERRADVVTDYAIDWIQTRKKSARENPFFAWVHYFDPHGPYDPPSPYRETFEKNPYDGEIAFVDAELGRLLAAIGRTGALDNTLVLFTADHGEGLGDHDEATHADLIYDSTLRVPWILSNPILFPTAQVIDDRLAATVDIVPTLAALTGLNIGETLDGIDLGGGAQPDRAVYIETLAPLLDYGWAPLHGLRRLGDKFIEAPEPEYFDLVADPHERSNLFDGNDVAAKRRSELGRRMSGWPSGFEVAGIQRELSTEELERLASLGYVSGQAARPPGTRDPKKMMPLWHRINDAGRRSLRGEHEQAIQTIRDVVQADPGSGKAWTVAMQIFDHAGMPAEAETCARRALQLRPSSDLWVNLARFALNRGDLTTFEGALAEAERLDPENGGIHIGHGHSDAIQGRYEEAREEFETAIRIDPVRSGAAAREQIRRLDTLIKQQR